MSNVVPIRQEEAVDAPAGFEEIPVLMSPRVLAEVLDVTPLTLSRWRDAKRGPSWHRIPGTQMIRYSRLDVLDWLASHRVEASG